VKKAVIVLPTYNEAKNVEELIPKIFQIAATVANWEIHVIIVDSYSPDRTEDAVIKLIKRYPRLHLLRLKERGLGLAYLSGFKTAIEKLQPYLLFEMDADLSHDPKNIPEFLKAIEAGSPPCSPQIPIFRFFRVFLPRSIATLISSPTPF